MTTDAIYIALVAGLITTHMHKSLRSRLSHQTFWSAFLPACLCFPLVPLGICLQTSLPPKRITPNTWMFESLRFILHYWRVREMKLLNKEPFPGTIDSRNWLSSSSIMRDRSPSSSATKIAQAISRSRRSWRFRFILLWRVAVQSATGTSQGRWMISWQTPTLIQLIHAANRRHRCVQDPAIVDY